MDYDMIDPILHQIVERKMKAKLVARKLGISTINVTKIKDMIENNLHKRRPPPFAPH